VFFLLDLCLLPRFLRGFFSLGSSSFSAFLETSFFAPRLHVPAYFVPTCHWADPLLGCEHTRAELSSRPPAVWVSPVGFPPDPYDYSLLYAEFQRPTLTATTGFGNYSVQSFSVDTGRSLMSPSALISSPSTCVEYTSLRLVTFFTVPMRGRVR